MKRTLLFSAAALFVISGFAFADTFGTGANQFEIEFVPISSDTNPARGYGIVNNDYRIGTYEITNDQWDKFLNAYGTIDGNPSEAYDENPHYTGENIPTNCVSWYETAQFVNWLNTSTGHQAAYKFTGTQGTGDYTMTVWNVTDAGYDTSNPYRNSNAFYFLPTEDEWVKAAYWNGVTMQTYATKTGDTLHQGDGMSGTGWNYYDDGYATNPHGPWDVGSGSEELNGTFDMMGNVWEWMESPYYAGDYTAEADRQGHGGAYSHFDYLLASSFREIWGIPSYEYTKVGFRVASVPEPATLMLLALGGLLIRKH